MKELHKYPFDDDQLEDYKVKWYKGITDEHAEEYVFLKRKNESDSHYLVTMDIYWFIKQYTSKVWLYQTVKPDIIFQVKDKKIAIEVETGKHHRKRLLAKVELLQDYDDWFFVVTDKNLALRYKEFGKTYTKRSIRKKLEKYLKNVRRRVQRISRYDDEEGEESGF